MSYHFETKLRGCQNSVELRGTVELMIIICGFALLPSDEYITETTLLVFCYKEYTTLLPIV